jgi:hypothetical protein
MEIGAEMRRKIIVSVLAVGVFVGIILGIGITYDSGGLDPSGGLALIGSIVLFVLLMAVVGFWISR